jgi:hypothetical protein
MALSQNVVPQVKIDLTNIIKEEVLVPTIIKIFGKGKADFGLLKKSRKRKELLTAYLLYMDSKKADLVKLIGEDGFKKSRKHVKVHLAALLETKKEKIDEVDLAIHTVRWIAFMETFLK